MSQNVIYVGIDVDDVRYLGSAVDKRTGEVLDFHCRATLKGLVGQLVKVQEYFWRRTAESVLRSVVRWLLATARPEGLRLSL